MMDATLADLLNRVRQPFNVNSVAQAAALAALADTEYVARVGGAQSCGPRAARASAPTRCASASCRRTAISFSFVSVTRPSSTKNSLRQGVIVRPVANYGLPEHLRVTVGLPEENARFLAALEVSARPLMATAEPALGKLVVVGVGLIGGSFALALKQAGPCRDVVGVGRGRANLDAARNLGIAIAPTRWTSRGPQSSPTPISFSSPRPSARWRSFLARSRRRWGLPAS